MKHTGATSTKTAYESGLKVFVIVVTAICLTGPWSSLSLAQVAPITSSGLNTQISGPTILPSGQTNYDITGGTRPGGGTNLFHSFGNFNVPNNNIANFLNETALPTSNILGRVTGGNISNIFGTIQTTGFGSANLFLMNPAGFLFGPNATLNVGGMVAFTSADYLRLADGALFNAVPNATADALLTAAPVVAFGFLGSNPGAITVQGSQFTVTEGTGISLVGGNITVQSGTLDNGTAQPAHLTAPNGQINLATTASPGEFLLQGLNTGGFQGPLAGPNVNGTSFTSFGSVHVAQGSTVDVSQTGNGKVSISGGQLVLDIQNALLSTADSTASAVVTPGVDTIVLAGGSSIISQTSSADSAPDVQVVADRIQFLGTPPIFAPDAPPTPPKPVNIFSDTFGSGDAGNITVTASQDINLMTNTIHANSTFPTSTGNAGNIDLSTTNGNISMTNGVFINSQASGAAGEAGTITVNAPHGDINMFLVVALNNTIGGIGSGASGGGGIEVTANNLNMGLFSNIGIDNFSLPVPKGITLNLSGSLNLSGNSGIFTIARGPALAAADLNITAHDVSISGGSFLNTETQSSGPGGQLNIFANNLSLLSGGQIKSGSTFEIEPNPNLPPIPILASGPGGTINIQGLSGPAASVLIDGTGSGIFTNTVGTGAGGNINISTHSLTVQNGGTISAATSGTAPSATGGVITVKADTVNLKTGGTMTAASTGPGASGEVVVEGFASPAHSILIDGQGSGIFTNTSSTGAGGDVHLFANSVTLQDGGTLSAASSGTASSATGGTITVNATDQVQMTGNATITASSTGPADAGNISINAGQLLNMSDSSIKTEAAQAAGGNIDIQAVQVVQMANSTISTSVLGGSGGGGNITIDPQSVILQNSQILAQAVQGPGGNIFITTNLLLQDANSVISASSRFGQNGTITIQSPINPAGGKIIPLSQKPLIATALLSQRCAALAGGGYSSFTVAGRDSLPAEPGNWLSSPLAALNAGNGLEARGQGQEVRGEGYGREARSGRREAGGESEGQEAEGERREAITLGAKREAGGDEETPILSLRQIAPPGFLTQHYAVESSGGCTS